MFAQYDERLGDPDIKERINFITQLYQTLNEIPTRPESPDNIALKSDVVLQLEQLLIVLLDKLATDDAHAYSQKWLAANRQETYQFIEQLNRIRLELNFPRSVTLEDHIQDLQGTFNNLEEIFGAEPVEHLRNLTLGIGLASTAGAAGAAAVVGGIAGSPFGGPIGSGIGAAVAGVPTAAGGVILTLYKRHSAKERALNNVENDLRAEFDFTPQ